MREIVDIAIIIRLFWGVILLIFFVPRLIREIRSPYYQDVLLVKWSLFFLILAYVTVLLMTAFLQACRVDFMGLFTFCAGLDKQDEISFANSVAFGIPIFFLWLIFYRK